jgi:hypothetical protein
MPAALKYACAVLLLASEGRADAVASALTNANRDGELRRFVLWLPFVLDNLWFPFSPQGGAIRMAQSPEGTSWEEAQQADRAFSRRPVNPPVKRPDPPQLDTPERILSRCEDIRKQQAKSASEAARGVRTDTSAAFRAFLFGEFGNAYPLPTLEPLWTAAQALNLGGVPPWPGEPQSGPEAFQALNALADWCRRQSAGQPVKSPAAPTPPPPDVEAKQAVPPANGAGAAVLCIEDKAILRVLSEAGCARTFAQICQDAAALVRKLGGAQAAGLVTLSETKVKERVPVLESEGLVSRPPGPQGRPTYRKGVGITDKGRDRLKNKSEPAP